MTDIKELELEFRKKAMQHTVMQNMLFNAHLDSLAMQTNPPALLMQSEEFEKRFIASHATKLKWYEKIWPFKYFFIKKI